MLKHFLKIIIDNTEQEKKEKELEEKEEQLLKYANRFNYKNQIKCNYCGKYVDTENGLCSNCGADLELWKGETK